MHVHCRNWLGMYVVYFNTGIFNSRFPIAQIRSAYLLLILNFTKVKMLPFNVRLQ